MKNIKIWTFLLIPMLFFFGNSWAEDMLATPYFGVGATSVEAYDETATGSILYAGWAVGYKDRPESFYTEFQLEAYEAGVVEVEQFSLHIMPAIYNGERHQFFVDFGFNLADFEAFGDSATEHFFSYGLGYRLKYGSMEIKVSYAKEEIDEVNGFSVDNPKKATVGINWKF